MAICSEVDKTEVRIRDTASEITQINVLLPCKKSTSHSCAIEEKILEPLLAKYICSMKYLRSRIVALLTK